MCIEYQKHRKPYLEPDFPLLLRNCALSISQAGYNTLLDIVRARARAVVIPFSAPGESEQAFRAGLFEARGLITVLPEAQLSPASLTEAADRIAASSRPPANTIRLDGASESARLIAELADRPFDNAA